MSKDPPKRSPKADADPAPEIRTQRKFSLAEAIGRLAGSGIMKGASPVSRKQQAEAAVEEFLTRHLADTEGALSEVMLRRVGESAALLDDLDRPLVVLAGYVRSVLGSEYLLKELVREADVEWGRASGERPHFDREGHPPHADDPYTVESVRTTLFRLIGQLNTGDT